MKFSRFKAPLLGFLLVFFLWHGKPFFQGFGDAYKKRKEERAVLSRKSQLRDRIDSHTELFNQIRSFSIKEFDRTLKRLDEKVDKACLLLVKSITERPTTENLKEVRQSIYSLKNYVAKRKKDHLLFLESRVKLSQQILDEAKASGCTDEEADLDPLHQIVDQISHYFEDEYINGFLSNYDSLIELYEELLRFFTVNQHHFHVKGGHKLGLSSSKYREVKTLFGKLEDKCKELYSQIDPINIELSQYDDEWVEDYKKARTSLGVYDESSLEV